MAKRRASIQLNNPLLKAAKPNIDGTFLAPLKNKINSPINLDESLRYIEQDVDKPIYQHPTYKQISDFISKQLANKTSPIDQRTFQKVNIRTGTGAGVYEPTTQELDIYDKDSPFKTFIHEGTHALDNLHMRTYQRQALDFLAKHGRDQQGNSITPSQDPGYWYERARKILPSQIFNQGTYKFGTGKYDKEGYPDVKQSIINDVNFSAPVNQNNNYEQAKDNYQNLQNNDNQSFMPLSEFTAFAVENLNTPWKIKSFKDNNDYNNKDFLDKAHGQNLGRKFLKKMTKATYTGFKDIYNQQPNQGQTFMQAYPAMHQSFVDRLSDLRNVNKYPTQADYTTRLQNRGIIQ